MREDVRDFVLFEKGFVDSKGNNRYFVNCPYCKKEHKPIWSGIATYEELKAHYREHNVKIEPDNEGNIYRVGLNVSPFIDFEGIAYPSIEECCKARLIPTISKSAYNQRYRKTKDKRRALLEPLRENLKLSEAKSKRLGETATMKCGLIATITAYDGCEKIQVTFQTGEVVNATYDNFRKRNISPISPKELQKKQADERLGETKTMNCGLKATIIEYNSATDITVWFENGVIKKSRWYKHFRLGSIKPDDAETRLGETRTMNCGAKATVIEYPSANECKIKFDNGEIRKVEYIDFANGILRPKGQYYNTKKVECIETHEVFNSLNEAGRKMNIDANGISLVCKNKQETAGGYHWGYV